MIINMVGAGGGGGGRGGAGGRGGGGRRELRSLDLQLLSSYDLFR